MPKGERPVKRVVGFSAAAWQEIASRWVDGVLRYLQEVPELGFRDFSFLEEMRTDALAPPPPWQGKADGMILGFGLHSDEDVEEVMAWLERGGAPAVSLVWDWRHPRLPVVTTDRDAVMTSAADYLVERGLRHFAMIDDAIGRKHLEKRCAAFSGRLAKHGFETAECILSFRPEGTREDFERIRGEESLARLLREAPKPLGVFAITDPQARAVCMLCEDLGIEVPGEVAVLGTGDLNISRRHSPTISSVRTGADHIGYEAVKLLHRLMDGGKAPSRPLLIGPEGVIERESTCPDYRKSNDIRRAVEFIQRHACEGINVEDVVRHLAVSRRTLEKHFRERLGHSPLDVIQQTRLARAKRLLAETELSVTKISELTGFSEHARLTTFFRKQTGLSPSGFRKRQQQ